MENKKLKYSITISTFSLEMNGERCSSVAMNLDKRLEHCSLDLKSFETYPISICGDDYYMKQYHMHEIEFEDEYPKISEITGTSDIIHDVLEKFDLTLGSLCSEVRALDIIYADGLPIHVMSCLMTVKVTPM